MATAFSFGRPKTPQTTLHLPTADFPLYELMSNAYYWLSLDRNTDLLLKGQHDKYYTNKNAEGSHILTGEHVSRFCWIEDCEYPKATILVILRNLFSPIR